MNRFNKPKDGSLDELKRFSDEQMEKYGVHHWILDESGNVIDASFIEWVLWFEKNHQRVIQQDYPGQYKVSTVFIGLENELFETMVFGPKEETEWFDGTKRLMRPSLWTERCRTLSEAKEMHERGLEWLKLNAEGHAEDQSCDHPR